MNGTGYTPSQVWMDYAASSLTDSDGNNVAGNDVYLPGEPVYKIGVEHWPDTFYRGNRDPVTVQGDWEDITYLQTSSSGTYQRTKTSKMRIWKGSTTTVVPRGESIAAVEYDDVLYQAGSSVTTVGKKATYAPSSANPRFYNASKATRVSLKKASLSTATATILKI